MRSLLLILGTALILSLLYLSRSRLQPLLTWLEGTVEQAGPHGPWVFMVGAAVWATLLLPGPLILALAGTLFSHRPLVGVASVSAGLAVSQGLAFLLTRGIFRERVVERVGHQVWFQWLEEQVERRGAFGVFLIRTIPVFPNALANYGFGVTRIGFLPYLVASWAGTLPIVLAYVYGTSEFVKLLKEAV